MFLYARVYIFFDAASTALYLKIYYTLTYGNKKIGLQTQYHSYGVLWLLKVSMSFSKIYASLAILNM